MLLLAGGKEPRDLLFSGVAGRVQTAAPSGVVSDALARACAGRFRSACDRSGHRHSCARPRGATKALQPAGPLPPRRRNS